MSIYLPVVFLLAFRLSLISTLALSPNPQDNSTTAVTNLTIPFNNNFPDVFGGLVGNQLRFLDIRYRGIEPFHIRADSEDHDISQDPRLFTNITMVAWAPHRGLVLRMKTRWNEEHQKFEWTTPRVTTQRPQELNEHQPFSWWSVRITLANAFYRMDRSRIYGPYVRFEMVWFRRQQPWGPPGQPYYRFDTLRPGERILWIGALHGDIYWSDPEAGETDELRNETSSITTISSREES